LSVERSTGTSSVISAGFETNLKVDGCLLTLILAGRQSKRGTVVVDSFLDKERNTIDCGPKDIIRLGACAAGWGRSDGNARNNGGSTSESRATDGDRYGDKLSDSRCSYGDHRSLSARTLRDVSRSRNDSNRAADR
jgi:hypothetical protein